MSLNNPKGCLMARSSCPNLNDLSSDAWEKLDSDAAQQLEQHLASCPECQGQLHQLKSDSEEILSGPQGVPPRSTPPFDEAELRSLLRLLRLALGPAVRQEAAQYQRIHGDRQPRHMLVAPVQAKIRTETGQPSVGPALRRRPTRIAPVAEQRLTTPGAHLNPHAMRELDHQRRLAMPRGSAQA
jgi:hypothetical protein